MLDSVDFVGRSSRQSAGLMGGARLGLGGGQRALKRKGSLVPRSRSRAGWRVGGWLEGSNARGGRWGQEDCGESGGVRWAGQEGN